MAKGLTPEQQAALRILGGMIGGAAGGFGVGRAAREGGRVWNTMSRPDAAKYGNTVEDRQGFIDAAIASREPRAPIDFDAGVVYIPGPAQNNAMLVRTPENLEAFLAQTQEEHDAALDKYMGDPNIPPERAVRLGIREEERLPKWWNDNDPRIPVTPSSSCVSSARIGPNGDIYIKFSPNGKEYQYEGSPDPVEASRILQQLVTAESIGRSVNSWTGDWGRAHTYLPKG